MLVAVDATNLKAGGGFTHLKQFSALLDTYNVYELHLFGGDWLSEIDCENQHSFVNYSDSK